MRKTIATFFMSLDGVVETPEEWHFPYFNEELGAALAAGLTKADTLLYGRKTYDTMAATWPEREAAAEAAGQDPGFAKTLGDTRKVVVSHQPLELSWRNSEQLAGDLIEGVKALKNQSGGDIALAGSVSVVRQLLDAGLLDELELFVDPLVLHKGMRLFEDGKTQVPLRLQSSQTFETGVVHLVYVPA